jgi:DNA-binding NarL/FixJ family response regulator
MDSVSPGHTAERSERESTLSDVAERTHRLRPNRSVAVAGDAEPAARRNEHIGEASQRPLVAREPGHDSLCVVVQSHHRLVREALALCLSKRPGVNVIGHTTHCAEVATLCSIRPIDVAIVDLRGPVKGMTAAVRDLHAEFSSLAIVGLYDETVVPRLTEWRTAGLSAIVPGARGVDGLLSTVYEQVGVFARGELDAGELTENELTVLWLMRSGHGVHEITELTGTCSRTVENLRRRIAPRTGTHRVDYDAERRRTEGQHVQVQSAETQSPVRSLREDVGPPLVVVSGQAGTAIDAVAATLLQHQVAFVLDLVDPDTEGEPQARPAPGQLAAVLVDPTPADWAAYTTLGAPAVIVHSGQVPGVLVAQGRRSALAIIAINHIDDDLVPALNLVSRGYVAIDASRAKPLLEVLSTRFDGQWPMALSAREYDILRSVARGESVRQTARALGIAPKTVENTQARLFRKLGVHNRPGALAAAQRLGLLRDVPELDAAEPEAG